jgi:hypothetical protein
MLSLRAMRLNIWAGLQSATPQEIADGLAFYPGAHGLCRLFSSMHPDVSTSHIAGIYAALSPLNTWDTNVANILDVLRDWSAASVNTTDANLHKALRIRCGEDPDKVLVGRKVRAFYRAIADPDDTRPIAVDRHLINLALDIVPSKSEQSTLANDTKLYTRVERVYTELGIREGLGNRLASIAWFVQRRIERTGQRPLLHPSAPLCCGKLMWSHGRLKSGTRTFYCSRCKSTQRPAHCLRIVRTPYGWKLHTGTEGLRVWSDSKGRRCVTLPAAHPYTIPPNAQGKSPGYQRLARFLIAEELGYLPRPDEHTHHRRGLTDDSLSSLDLVHVSYHGQIHASAVYVARDEQGRFKPLNPPEGIYDWPRRGAILGNAARTDCA